MVATKNVVINTVIIPYVKGDANSLYIFFIFIPIPASNKTKINARVINELTETKLSPGLNHPKIGPTKIPRSNKNKVKGYPLCSDKCLRKTPRSNIKPTAATENATSLIYS